VQRRGWWEGVEEGVVVSAVEVVACLVVRVEDDVRPW
jgi:hypothetical protein